MDASQILILGRGRLGGALARALSSGDGRPTLISGRPRGARERRRSAAAIAEARAVLLCVPDSAVSETAARIAAELRPGQLVAHCSGALELTALEPAAAHGALVGSLHPLCAVPSPRAPLAGAWAALSGSPRARRALASLARKAGLHPFELPGGERALYHAAAAIASNGLVALAAEAAALLARCGVGEKEAQRALLPLMRSALAGLEARGLPGALTGPVARGDASTVAAHLEVLGEVPGSALPLYLALGQSLLPLSAELGQAGDHELNAMRALLAAGPARRRRRA